MQKIGLALVLYSSLVSVAFADASQIRSARDYVRIIYGSGAAAVPKIGCPCGIKRWKPYHNKWTGHAHVFRRSHVHRVHGHGRHDIHCSTPGLHAWWRPTFCRKRKR